MNEWLRSRFVPAAEEAGNAGAKPDLGQRRTEKTGRLKYNAIAASQCPRVPESLN
jgi:hypothetical protein